MSSAAQAKAAGLKLGADRKKMTALGVLVLLAIVLFWYNSKEDRPSGAPPVSNLGKTAGLDTPAAPSLRTPARAPRRAARTAPNDRGTLRLRAIDATRGDVDPTLRLDLLERVKSVESRGGARNLFDVGAAPAEIAARTPIKGPIIVPGPIPANSQSAAAATPAIVPIPLKFYGFVRPNGPQSASRGFFLDGDNILVAAEGEVVKQRYRIVQLAAGSALVEDTEAKSTQTLPLVPEARNEQ